MTPCQERAEASARKKRTFNGKQNRKHPEKVAIKKLATKLADLRAELEAARREGAMRANRVGLNDEVIKHTTEKPALKTELTTRTTAWSQTLAYKKTEEAGQNREELRAFEGRIIESLRHEHEHEHLKIQNPPV